MMRRTALWLVMMVCCHMTIMADNLGYSKGRPLLFGVDVDYAPLEYVDEHGMPQGLDVQFTQELLKRLDIPYTYSPNTWENISDDVLEGKVDLGMMVYSSYRKDITNYSRPVFRLYYQIVCRSEDLKSGRIDLRNLSGMNIAHMSSRPLSDTLSKAGAVPSVVKDLPRAMFALSKGKYDAVICFRYQATFLIDNYRLDNLRAEDMSLQPREYCYVSHSKKLIKAINDELDKMEDDGIVIEIYGNDVASVGSFRIPEWLWYSIAVVAVLMFLVFIIFQFRYQRRLKREMERAQRSERMKMVFLGNVSHALRTPLNSIIGFSDVMMGPEGNRLSDDERRNMLKLINDNGNQLLYFINELLQLSNIEGNDLKVNQTEINLAEEMEKLAEETRPILKEGVVMKVEGKGGKAFIDVNLMRLVTMHCLQNAAKYTDKGEVRLIYGSEGKGLRIEVRDTGRGLPPQLKDNLFSLLTEKSTYTQEEEVPGLGLSICKAVVERRGGRIGAESLPEGGTSVWHWIPIKVYY